MLSSVNALLIIKIIIILAGLAIFCMGFFYSKKDKGKLKLKRCSKQTYGHVTGFDDREKIIKTKKYTEYRNSYTYHRKKVITYYTPYVEFEDEEGNKYEMKYPYPIEKHFSINQKILIKYNPQNPYDFYISGDRKIQVFSTQAMAAGIIMIVAGILLLLNVIKI